MQEIKLINFINLNEEEIRLIHKWRNNENVRKYMFNNKEISINSHISFINTLKSSTNKKYFLITQDDNYLGVITFKEIDFTLKQCHIGLYSNPYKKGLGEILINQCIEYSFNILRLNKIIAQVFTINKNAIKLYDRVGFKEIKKISYEKKELAYMEMEKIII